MPFSDCSNCCGSPSRTRLLPADAQANTFCQRHLARLINKEHIDGIHKLRTRPQKWSTTEHLYGTALQIPEGFVIRRDLSNWVAAGTISPRLVCTSDARHVRLSRSPQHFLWLSSCQPPVRHESRRPQEGSDSKQFQQDTSAKSSKSGQNPQTIRKQQRKDCDGN